MKRKKPLKPRPLSDRKLYEFAHKESWLWHEAAAAITRLVDEVYRLKAIVEKGRR